MIRTAIACTLVILAGVGFMSWSTALDGAPAFIAFLTGFSISGFGGYKAWREFGVVNEE